MLLPPSGAVLELLGTNQQDFKWRKLQQVLLMMMEKLPELADLPAAVAACKEQLGDKSVGRTQPRSLAAALLCRAEQPTGYINKDADTQQVAACFSATGENTSITADKDCVMSAIEALSDAQRGVLAAAAAAARRKSAA